MGNFLQYFCILQHKLLLFRLFLRLVIKRRRIESLSAFALTGIQNRHNPLIGSFILIAQQILQQLIQAPDIRCRTQGLEQTSELLILLSSNRLCLVFQLLPIRRQTILSQINIQLIGCRDDKLLNCRADMYQIMRTLTMLADHD